MSAGLVIAADQRAAAVVLVKLLDRGLPQVTWTVSDVGLSDLNGQIGSANGDLAHRLRALTDYARLFGAPATLHRYHESLRGALHVVGSLDGVPVNVWTPVDADEMAAIGGPEFAGMLGERWACSDCHDAMFTLSCGVNGGVPAWCPDCAPYARR